MPETSALACPNCGAPLPAPAANNAVLCVYCNSAIRLQAGEATPTAVVEYSLEEAQMARLKQLILDGKKAEVIPEYQQITGASQADAARTIEELENTLSMGIVLRQQLTPLGWGLFVGSLLVLGGCAYAYLNGRLSPWLAAPLALISLANIALYARSLRTSLEFLGAPVARARVLKLAQVGEVRMGRQMVHTFKVLLEVRPEDAPAFQAEMLLPVRHENLERVRTGVDFKVKYLRDNPQRLVYQD